jgi:hypothetical protein
MFCRKFLSSSILECRMSFFKKHFVSRNCVMQMLMSMDIGIKKLRLPLNNFKYHLAVIIIPDDNCKIVETYSKNVLNRQSAVHCFVFDIGIDNNHLLNRSFLVLQIFVWNSFGFWCYQTICTQFYPIFMRRITRSYGTYICNRL